MQLNELGGGGLGWNFRRGAKGGPACDIAHGRREAPHMSRHADARGGGTTLKRQTGWSTIAAGCEDGGN